MNPFLSHRNYMAPRSNALFMSKVRASAKDGIVRRWARAVTKNWKRRRMIAALHAMDDRLLRDIGIYRNDIERVVDGFDERELRMVPIAPPSAATIDNHDAKRLAA